MERKMRILILCTGNSCRSQMAHGVLQSLDPNLEVFSAGTKPTEKVNPKAVKVMNEIGIDISGHVPHNVAYYTDESWDYVITVCGGAKETCPVFNRKVGKRIHIGFDDPSEIQGEEETVLHEFRKTRDEIKEQFTKFYNDNLR